MKWEEPNIEDQLRAALRREPPPPEFAAKVVARARTAASWRKPAALALAAGFGIAAVIPPAVSEYRAYEAKAQLLQALAITRVQFEQVRQKIQRNTRRAL